MGSSGGVRESSSPSPSFSTPATTTDRSVLRFISTDGSSASDSLLTISDAGIGSGLTQLNLDNLRLDGNTLSSTNTNGNLSLTPNGTGSVVIPNGSVSTPGLSYAAGSGLGFYVDASTVLNIVKNGAILIRFNGTTMDLPSSGALRIGPTSDPNAGTDTNIYRSDVSQWTTGNSAGGISSLLTARAVEASTAGVGAPNILASSESRKLLTNEGATAEAYNTLPVGAPIGCEFAAYCADTDGIRVTAPSGETIRIETSVSASGGFIRSVVIGSGIVLTKVKSTEWAAVSKPSGTWTIDT